MPTWNQLRHFLLFATIGFVAMAAQILLMRRLVIVFGGNELVTGGVLAGWLGFSGLGALIAGALVDRLRSFEVGAAISIALLALCIPAVLILTFFLKPWLGIPLPLMVGPGMALLASAIVIAPVGLLIGTSFVICCCLIRESGPRAIARVYLLDALGAGLGGLLFSLVAIRHFTSLESALLCAGVTLAALGFVLKQRLTRGISFLLVCMLALLLLYAPRLERLLTETLWRGYHPIARVESLLSTLMVTDNRGERTLFVDGSPAFSLPLPETYESLAHLPLLEHPHPKAVLMIEGGVSGILHQWRKQELHRADFTRIDPDITLLEREAMPSELRAMPAWANLHHVDGRRFLQQDAEGARYDVIIINVGSPQTASTDRYFTQEFFQETKKRLEPGGVLALWLLEPSNVISQETARILGATEKTLESTFSHVMMLPLDRFYFFASEEPGKLTSSITELLERLARREIDAPFLEQQILAGTFQERVTSFQETVHAAAKTQTINRDRQPHGYFNSMLLWERRFGGSSFDPMRAVRHLRPWMGVMLLLILVGASIPGARRADALLPSVWTLAAVGCATMTFEIVLLIHYQMAMGMLLWQLGLLMTLFMLGAGIGCFASTSLPSTPQKLIERLLLCLLLLMPLMLLLFPLTRVSFLASSFLVGLLGGAAYQHASQLILASKRTLGQTAGMLEGADHWGAVAGSLLTSLIIVPIFGLFAALWMASIVLAAPLILLLLQRQQLD